MAGKTTSRHAIYLVLAGIMAIGLAVALIGGSVAILRIGQPESASATWVAEISAWIFAAAFLASFFLATSDELEARRSGH